MSANLSILQADASATWQSVALLGIKSEYQALNCSIYSSGMPGGRLMTLHVSSSGSALQVTSFTEEHLVNAPAPMEVTLAGIVTVVRLSQLA